jgi:FkbM family methyltransferase
MSKALSRALKLRRMIEVVDIGSNPIDGEPTYKKLVRGEIANVTGFEPQPDAYEALMQMNLPGERHLPYAVGDGKTHTLHICRAPGLASLLEPDPAGFALFDVLNQLSEVIERIPIETKRLDDIEEIETIDVLKMDIQGGELMVLQHGAETLKDASVLQIEASFVTLYKDQPTIGDIDNELRKQGFMPHCIAEFKRWIVAPCVIKNDPRQPLNQALEADLVYIRDLKRPEAISDDQLRVMAIVCGVCFGSIDIGLRCLMHLEERGAVPKGVQNQYLEYVRTL